MLRLSSLLRLVSIMSVLLLSSVARADAPEDRILGNAEAPVTIIEYASLSCPHCANFHATRFKWIKENYIDTGKVKFIFRDFPLNQPALLGSMLAQCAPPERYYAFLDLLFRQQATWAFSESVMEELAKIARVGGIGKAAFDDCMSNVELSERIIESRKIGVEKYDVASTPSLIVDGKLLKGIPSENELTDLINKASR